MASGYHADTPALKNMMLLVVKNITLYGFRCDLLAAKYEEQFYQEIPGRIASGELQYLEDVTRGLQNGAEAIRAVQHGANVGKGVLIVADE